MRAIATTLSTSKNRIMLDSSSLLLDGLGDEEPPAQQHLVYAPRLSLYHD